MPLTQVDGGLLSPTNGQFYSMKNRIINGAMMIDQRNAGASVTPTASGYALDRWLFDISQTSKFSVQQSSVAPAGYTKSMLITSLSAYSVGSNDYFQASQPIEGFNVADLGFGAAGASPVTISFWARSSLTGTFGGCLKNGNSTRSYPFTYTINAANTWEQKTVTIAGDITGTWATDNSRGMQVVWSLGMGSTYSGAAGAWAGSNFGSATGATSVVSTNGATFYITGAQLEKGSTATSFDYRPYGTELALCQRYYVSNFDVGVAPSQGGSADNRLTIGTIFNSTDLQAAPIAFPVAMRTTPSITFYRPSFIATNGNWAVYPMYWGGGGFTATVGSVTNLRLVPAGSSISGGTNYNSYIMSGYFAASAEL